MSCIFCNIVKEKAPSWTIYQDKHISAFFDYNPASKGHLLIVPNKHFEDIYITPTETLEKIIALSKKIALFYKKELGISNINFVQSNGVFAGQEVMHYHMHMIPRGQDDHVNLHWNHNEKFREEYDELKKFIAKGIK